MPPIDPFVALYIEYLTSVHILPPYQEEKKEKKYGDIIFRENDRIMQIKNNYDIYWEKNNDEVEYGSGVFNGEFGTIIKINESEKQIKIKFDDEKVAWYQYTDLDQIEHAYAITVHKAHDVNVFIPYLFQPLLRHSVCLFHYQVGTYVHAVCVP